MRKNYTEIIEAVEAEATRLQAEIDAAIDKHGVMSRFIEEMRGPGTVVQWTPTTVEVPSGRDLDVPVEEVRAGLLVAKAPAKKAAKPKTSKTRTVPDYPAIAAWISEAKAKGTYSTPAMAKHFGVTEMAAKNYPKRCKQHGLLGGDTPAPTPPASPAERPFVKADGPTQPMLAARQHVLACCEDECEFECSTSEAHRLHRHFLDEHGRRPHTFERQPVLAGAA